MLAFNLLLECILLGPGGEVAIDRQHVPSLKRHVVALLSAHPLMQMLEHCSSAQGLS